MEELQKNTEPEDSKEELNTSEGIAQELLKMAKKQLFYTRLSTCFVGVMAAAIVISLFSVVPRANHLLGNANALLGEVNDRLEVLGYLLAIIAGTLVAGLSYAVLKRPEDEVVAKAA